MTENEKKIPETSENKPLADEQLDEVSGGKNGTVIIQPVRRKICATDSSHIYLEIYSKCPVCGSKEYTDIR